MENYLGKNIPKLGFGLMRLPMEGKNVDIEQTKTMVDLFLSKGFTYFDTAFGYLEGESEKAIKKALVDRYPRESYQLATKLPAWAGPKTKEEAEQMLSISLERTGAGYFDFYLLHNLGEARTHFFDDYDIWNFVQRKKEEGLIRHIGFSFHDKASLLDEILSKHPEVEFVQLQINYADWENPTIESKLCYETAMKYGKPVIVMEPLKGGVLSSPPPAVENMLKNASNNLSVSSWGVRYAASLPGIITVLSGMSAIEQMEDNISYMEHFQPLTPSEQETIKEAQNILSSIKTVPCTACAYCMKNCPQNIAIYGTFQAMNAFTIYGNLDSAKHSYAWNTDGHGLSKASSCIECGKCEYVCPQHIKIREELKLAAKTLES